MTTIEQIADQDTGQIPAETGEHPTGNIPANWKDLLLYLVGCVGSYFLFSLIVAMIYGELNLTVTFLGALLNFLCFTGGVYLFGVRRGKLSWQGIGLLPAKNFMLAVVGSLAITLLLNFFRYIVLLVLIVATGADMSSLAGREAYFQIGMDTWQGVVLSLVGIGILAPIGEELFFRGLLYDWFRQKMPLWAAVVISSVLFGLAHYDSWMVMISTFIMGVGLALAYQYTKSIWTSILIHIFTNFGSILLMVVVSRFTPAFGL